MNNSRREKLACFTWKRATLVGAGLLALSVSAYAAPSQAAEREIWNASPRALTFCSTMGPEELQAAVLSGECASYLAQLGDLAPSAGLATPREPVGDGPSDGPRPDRDPNEHGPNGGGSGPSGSDGGDGDGGHGHRKHKRSPCK